MKTDVDFVLLWVDGNDRNWIRELEKWKLKSNGDRGAERYRDWNNLQYIFRAFEKFTPWVRKIHFVTWKHLPKWLNTKHPKLNIVKHEDFIDKKYLPVFNSHAIELNIHLINDLSNNFVYFNDDTFLIKKTNKERFFKNNLPRDMFTFTTLLLTHLSHIRVNDLLIINKYFDKQKVIKDNFFKIFNLKYGLNVFKSLLLLPWPQITGIVDPHQPQPFLKSTFDELWEKEYEILSKTCMSKFRNNSDVNQYLFRYWQLMKGDFLPVSFNDSYCMQIKNLEDAQITKKLLNSNKYSFFCINDMIEDDNDDFETIKDIVNEELNKILPDKSSFEI